MAIGRTTDPFLLREGKDMSFDFLRKTFLGTPGRELAPQILQVFPLLILNRSRFIFHPLSTIRRSNRKRSADDHGATLFLRILSIISKTIYPIRTELIHSRWPKVCLLTTVFFAVSPHKLWMLRVVKK